MNLTVQNIGVVQPVTNAEILKWLNLVLSKSKHATLTIRFVGSKESRLLNRQYRNKDYPTNVLTFAYATAPLQADLVLCTPVLRREAKEQGKHLRDHLAHLIIHGALHSLGYDHETKGDAKIMEAIEIKALKRLAIGDPYADSPA